VDICICDDVRPDYKCHKCHKDVSYTSSSTMLLRRMEEWRYSSAHSSPRIEMEVSVHLHAPAA